MKRPPRYDETTEAVIDSFARTVGLDPDAFRRWTRGVEAPPPWFRDALETMLFPLAPELPLPSPPDGATITTPMQLESTQKKVRGVPPTKHPFAEALRKRGVSIAEWAGKHGVSPSYARSWIQKGVGARPIPKKFAAAIEREFGIPETAWKNGTTK